MPVLLAWQLAELQLLGVRLLPRTPPPLEKGVTPHEPARYLHHSLCVRAGPASLTDSGSLWP